MQLLVELGAEPAELDRAAQLVGLDHLVEPGGEHAIGERLAARRNVLGRLERRVAALAVVGAMSCRVLQPLARPGLGGLIGAGAGVGFARRVLGGLGSTFPLSIFAGLLLLLSFVLLGIRVFRLLAELFGQTQMGEQLAHAQRERLLVGQMRAQIAPVLAGPALQPGAPVIELRPLLPRQVEPEQALLRVQLQRRREIGLLVARGAGRAAMARSVRAGEIGGDAKHALGAESLDPDLLESAEDRLRHLAVRRQTMVQLGVMMT